MQDFNDYVKNNNDAKNNNAYDDIMQKVSSIAGGFDGKNQTDLMRAIYEEAKKGKKNGTLKNSDIDNFALMLAPMLDSTQKLEETHRHFSHLMCLYPLHLINYDTDEPMTDVQKKLVSLISDNYKAIYKIFSRGKTEEEKLYLRLLLVTDYICGMTDSYAKQLYQEFGGIV